MFEILEHLLYLEFSEQLSNFFHLALCVPKLTFAISIDTDKEILLA